MGPGRVETSPCLELSSSEACVPRGDLFGEGMGNSRKAGGLPTPGCRGSGKEVEAPEATSGHLVPLGVLCFYSFRLLLQLFSHSLHAVSLGIDFFLKPRPKTCSPLPS